MIMSEGQGHEVRTTVADGVDAEPEAADADKRRGKRNIFDCLHLVFVSPLLLL